MPLITQSVGKDYAEMYSGYDQQEVGLGLINPNIYASPEYQGKKVRNVVLGGLHRLVYAGMEHDPRPLYMPMIYEPRYNTLLGINYHYIPPQARKAAFKFILDSNVARIRSNQPIIVDYQNLKRAAPQVRGAVRRYKVVGIGGVQMIPLVEWPEVINESSGWENHWRLNVSN